MDVDAFCEMEIDGKLQRRKSVSSFRAPETSTKCTKCVVRGVISSLNRLGNGELECLCYGPEGGHGCKSQSIFHQDFGRPPPQVKRRFETVQQALYYSATLV